MKNQRPFAITFLTLLFALSLHSQNFGNLNRQPGITGKIDGFVMDSISGEPIEFATVALRHQDTDTDIDGSITSSKGQFKIIEVKQGSYDLYISFIGYRTYKISAIKLTPEKPDWDCGTITLQPDEVLLEQVEVIGQAALVENKIDRIVYNADKDVSTIGGDATDVLRKVPMLSVDLDGNVSLRGSSNIKILLNGKPSGMFSNNVADALKMFPADQIKSVEVITTPGAKYDAEGTGGIININTKKSEVQGYSGSFTGAVGTRQNRASLNVNAAKGRFGMNGAGNVFYSWPQDAENSFYREDQVGGQQRILDQKGITNNSRIGFWGQAGAFYDFNAYNSINSSFNLRGHSFDRDGFQDALLSDPVLNLNQIYRRNNIANTLRSGYDWTTDYRKTYKTPQKEFSIAFQLSGNASNDETVISQISEDPGLVYDERNFNDGDNLESTLQVDYTHPFSKKLKMEIGAKTVIRNIKSDYTHDLYDPDLGRFQEDVFRSNLFNYDQNVYAGYMSFTLGLGEHYSLIAGGRFEQTNIQGDFQARESSFSNDYGNFVPSIIVSRKFGFNTLKASYVKRIQRPSLFYINPYINSDDRFNISFGNPGLAPEISNQFDLGYTSFKRGTVIAASIYYRRTTDVIQSLLDVNEDGVSITSYQNIGINDAVGANVFTSFSIKQFWTLRANVDIYSFEAKSTQPNLNLRNDGVQYRIFMNSSFDFKKGFQADLFGIFNSPRLTLQGKNPSFSMFSLGLKKEILQERGSLGLTVIDPFNPTKSFKSELRGDDFYQTTNFEIPFRSFGINFSYRFGKLDFQTRQRRSKIQNTDLKQGESNQGGDSGGTGGNNRN